MEVKSVEKKENNTATITVALSHEEFENALNKAYKKAKGSIMVPGFRKGKAPRKMIESMYGESIFYDDAINDVAPEAYYFSVKEAELKVVAMPSIEKADVTEDKGLELVINATLYPEVKLGQYKGLEAVRKAVTVDPYEVDSQIELLRNRNSSLITAERAAKFGDTVVIDYEGTIDGVPFDGGKDENYSLEIGSNTFIPGFEVQCIGASAGSEVDVNVTFPENYQAEELRGKPAVFHVKVHEVKEKLLPELDDEFAKDVSEFDTLEEFKKDLHDKLYKQKDDKARDEFLDLLMAQVIEGMEVTIPDGMVDERAEKLVNDFAYRLQGSGMTVESYLKMFQMSMDDFLANARENARKQLTNELALTKVAELEALKVEEEDRQAEYEKMAAQYGVDVESVKSFFDMDALEDAILLTKAANFIVDNAVALPEPPQEDAAEKSEEKAAEPAEEEKPAEEAKPKTRTRKKAAPKADVPAEEPENKE